MTTFNVLLNGYPVASAGSFQEALKLVGNPRDGVWVIEDGYGRQVWPKRDAA